MKGIKKYARRAVISVVLGPLVLIFFVLMAWETALECIQRNTKRLIEWYGPSAQRINKWTFMDRVREKLPDW